MRHGKRPSSFDSDEGIDFVRCRICGDHRRVISGRHLSKHDTDRETYMAEYHLTPDELIAKDFRRIQSSRRGYWQRRESMLPQITLIRKARHRDQGRTQLPPRPRATRRTGGRGAVLELYTRGSTGFRVAFRGVIRSRN